jgi:hypothetical protein
VENKHYPCAPKKIVLMVEFSAPCHTVQFFKFASDKEPMLSIDLPYRTLGRITQYIACRRKRLGEDIRPTVHGMTVTYTLA